MAKTKISEYSTTNSSNSDINSINIAEGCAPSGINNAIREVMVHLKEFQTGSSSDPLTVAGAFVASSGATLSGTNTLSGANIISGNINSSGTNTFSGAQVITGNINSSGTNTFSGSTRISSASITGGSISGITDLAVADGGTGASDAATARTNLGAAPLASPTFTGVPAAPTAAAGTNTTQIATTAFVTTAARALYPVGSIYINATNSTNPGTLLGFGTWVAFGAGRVPVGFDSTDTLFDSAEETGGSKDAIAVAHTHTFSATTNTTGSHNHGYTGIQGTGYPDGAGDSTTVGNNVSYPRKTQLLDAGDHSHTISGTTASTGSSGTNANLQPYITVYMWKRTA